MYNPKTFLQAIEQSFKNHKEFTARSPERAKPLHKYLISALKKIWGKDFHIESKATINGKYYPKQVNVTVFKENEPIFCVGISATYSSFKKNTKNQITNLLGDTANIQGFEKTPYAQLLILRHPCPVIENGQIEKFENVEKEDLEKYVKLCSEVKDINSPYITGIFLVEIDEETHKVKPVEADLIYPKKFAYFLEKKLSMENFFREIEYYKKFYTLIN